MPGNKISNAPENKRFAVSFMLLELRMVHKEDYMKWEKARQGLDYRIVQIMCSLKGGPLQKEGSEETYFKGVLT